MTAVMPREATGRWRPSSLQPRSDLVGLTSIMVALYVLAAPASAVVKVNNMLRSAPQMCPIDNGNLIANKLFVKDAKECERLCESHDGCKFFRFYEAKQGGNWPSQCYLFKTCGRKVEPATFDCALNSETTLEVKPFIKSEKLCSEACQQHKKCGYYKYFGSEDENKPEFCYLQRSCSKRMIDNLQCTLGKNNFLDIKLFVQNLDDCQAHCQNTPGCRYYWWHPIEHSDSPLYCYLYQQCAAGDREPEVAMVVGGRHPGHYFLTKEDHNDIVMRHDVCMLGMSAESRSNPGFDSITLSRAGAVAEFVNGYVIFCGGRNGVGVHSDCLVYDPTTDQWANHTSMLKARDEPVSATVGNKTFVIGGFGERSMEYIDMSNFVPETLTLSGNRLIAARSIDISAALEDFTTTEGYNFSSAASLLPVILGSVPSTTVRLEGQDLDESQELFVASNAGIYYEDAIEAQEEAALGYLQQGIPGGSPRWQLGPPMPRERTRACGVATRDGSIYVIGGHGNGTLAATKSVFRFSTQRGEWASEAAVPDMLEPRKDHACLYIELETTHGILVTGGLGAEGTVLHSTEFLDLKENKWIKTSSLKVGRTEHVMALVYGIPTVIGGLSDHGFLSSIEQFDKSSASWNVPLQRDWRIINYVLNSPRYEMAVASIPVSKLGACSKGSHE